MAPGRWQLSPLGWRKIAPSRLFLACMYIVWQTGSAMRATASLAAAQPAQPRALIARAQPPVAYSAPLPARQRAVGAAAEWAGGGGSWRTSGQQVCWAAGGSSGPNDSGAEDLINARYDLSADEQSWLTSWQHLSAAVRAVLAGSSNGEVNVALRKLLRAFASFSPSQKWRVAWTQLDAAGRQQLVRGRLAASSEEEFLQQAAAEFEGWMTGSEYSAELSTWLVLAAAYSRRSVVGAAVAAAAALAFAVQLAADSGSGSSISALPDGQIRAEVVAHLPGAAAVAGALALAVFGWQQAAAATWVLPAVPWGGGRVIAVLAACAAAESLVAIGVAAVHWTAWKKSGSMPPDSLAGTVLAILPLTLGTLWATATILHQHVLSPYPQTFSLGLCTASLWPLRSWLPAVVAFSALQACLWAIGSQVAAAAR